MYALLEAILYGIFVSRDVYDFCKFVIDLLTSLKMTIRNNLVRLTEI